MSNKIRKPLEEDYPEWLRMRLELWPGYSVEVHQAALRTVSTADRVAFVVTREGRGLCGFIEGSLRPMAEGCGTGPVGHVAAWYVDLDFRGRGIGRRLMAAVENWARERGCREMASDTDIENAVSQCAHTTLGYQEVSRLVHYRKPLVIAPIKADSP
jgi:aminoglycoside 6'-N-acetyltransferase I